MCGYTYPDSLVQTYDVFGNLSKRTRATYTGGAPGSGCTETGTALDYEFHWYGTDNKLMVLQRDAGSPDRTTRNGTWEEYWYDALGRRILIRERREDLANGSNQESALTQVLWDRDRILYELRSQPPNGLGGGPSNRYGTLGYIHGRELDAPLALTDGRILIPDFRGAYQGSVFSNGTPADCATGQASPCTAIEFPAGNIAATFRQFVVSPSGVTYTWRGSLIGAGRDGSGLMYRRNRYYDPLTGRFTQTDSIGIAGGLNVYGFAEGNPVSFSDPFGLCVPINVCLGIAIGAVGFVSQVAYNVSNGRPWHQGVGSATAKGAALGLTLGLIAPAVLHEAATAVGTLSGPATLRLVEPAGHKLSQMIARWHSQAGGSGGREAFMNYAQGFAERAQAAGAAVSGEVMGVQVTIYRMGDAFLKVDQATGKLISYVPRADAAWGIAKAYRDLGGR